MPAITKLYSRNMRWTAAKIKRLREAAGMSQPEFAAWLMVTPTQVRHLEHGRRGCGGPLARLLDVLAAWVQTGDVQAVLPKRKRGKL